MIRFIKDWFDRRRRLQEARIDALNANALAIARIAEMVMASVDKVSETQQAQIKAIDTHLSLFRPAESPQAFTNAGSVDDKSFLEQTDFPFDGTPQQMAEYIERMDTDD